jgi:hypothetical protein
VAKEIIMDNSLIDGFLVEWEYSKRLKRFNKPWTEKCKVEMLKTQTAALLAAMNMDMMIYAGGMGGVN